MAYLSIELAASPKLTEVTVTANVYIHDTGASWNHYSPSGTITIDGTKYTFRHSFDRNQSKQWLGSASKTLSYPSGQTQVTVSAQATFATNVSLGTLSASKSITAKVPYKGATVTEVRVNGEKLTTNSICLLGEDTITVTISKTSRELKYQRFCVIGRSEHTYGDYSSAVGTETWSLTPNLSYYGDFMSTLTEATLAIGVQSLAPNGTIVSRDFQYVKLKIPEEIRPTLAKAAVAIKEHDLSGRILQNRTTLEAAWTYGTQSLYGASIKRVTFTGADGIRYAEDAKGSGGRFSYVHSKDGEKTWQIVVTDSRGRSSTYTGTYTVVAYALPKLTRIGADRSTETGTLTATGGYAKVAYSGEIAPAEGLNSGTLTIQLVDGKESTTKSTISIDPSSPVLHSSSIISGITPTKSYVIVVELTDATGAVARLTAAIQKAGVIFDLSPTGLGFGTTALSGFNTFDEVVRPTKGLHDYGENSNGSWVRYGNGVQMCWMSKTIENATITTAYGSIYYRYIDWAFPQAFTGQVVVLPGYAQYAKGIELCSVFRATATETRLAIISFYQRSDGDRVIIQAMAIGRWR